MPHIRWREVSSADFYRAGGNGGGHGFEFYSDREDEGQTGQTSDLDRPNSVAFIAGFDWTRVEPEDVEVFINQSHSLRPERLALLKRLIESFVRGGWLAREKSQHSQLGEGFHFWLNA